MTQSPSQFTDEHDGQTAGASAEFNHRRKKWAVVLGVVSLLVALACGVGVVAAVVSGAEDVDEQADNDLRDELADPPAVGECLTVTDTGPHAKPEGLPCDDVGATYRVAELDGVCDKAESTFTFDRGLGAAKSTYKACLELNADEGDCFEMGGDVAPMVKVECAASDPVGLVYRIDARRPSGSSCEGAAQPLLNETRGTVLCLVPLG